MTPLFSPGLRMLSLLTVAASLSVPLAAQSLLCVDYHGKAYVVRQVHGGDPYVMENGKLVSAVSKRCVLTPAKSFLPAFISVRNLDLVRKHRSNGDTGTDLNHELHFQANFETLDTLKNVFFALEFDTDQSGKVVLYYEIGDLEPGKSLPVGLTVKLREDLGDGQYQLHLFADGAEVLHSQQSPAFREAAIAAIVAQRISGVKDAPPKPFFGPDPEYPTALLKTGTKGDAVMKIRIASTGIVLETKVEHTTDPAFGEAALAAIHQWCFLPQMKDGHPVESWATMPFVFAPPAAPGKS